MMHICKLSIMSGFESLNIRESPCQCGKGGIPGNCGGVRIDILFEHGFLRHSFDGGTNALEVIDRYVRLNILSTWEWNER